ncbi:hypothetical protein Cpir12675_000424 [Ceratocystis pirilliformis]|uniref:Tuberous sclerosis 1 protein n=1 Tax=Ceratocystis pirilliformis TaxID=259994 RepID=A0ABR3ZLG7_9PEZI
MAPNGSFKELCQALNAFIINPTLPLPEDLNAVFDAFYRKHDKYDDSNADRLQDELQVIWDKHVASDPQRYAPFVAICSRLFQALHTTERIFYWWDLTLQHMANQMIKDKSLQAESYQALLQLLVAENDQDQTSEDDAAAETASRSMPFLDRLLHTWLFGDTEIPSDLCHQLGKHQQTVLVSFGKKKPRELMACLNKYFVRAEFRLKCLILLNDLVQTQSPHLHLVLQTPLFGNLLACLENDASTTVINLGLTLLVMLLPNMPTSLIPYLPALFNVYARLLFCNRGRHDSAVSPPASKTASIDSPLPSITSNDSWDICAFDPQRDGRDVPQLCNYFTILYGLYPINFMDYIRKPQRYLRHANAPSANWFEIQSTEIRQLSERFRCIHVLHPNFYSLTIESEKTDFSRWLSSNAAELVTDCMSLCIPSTQPIVTCNDEVPVGKSLANYMANADCSIDSPVSDSPIEKTECSGSSLLSNSPDDYESAEESALAQTSSEDTGISIGAESSTCVSQNHNEPKPTPSVACDTSHPENLTPTQDNEYKGKAESFDSSGIAHQIFMLQNELRFEKYLKQQHSAHIGVLRRRLHQQAASEAETQNLIIMNRHYKKRFDEAKVAETMAKKDYERGRSLSMKRETDMMAKNKILREDLRARKAEVETLKRDIEAYKAEADRLTKLMCALEEKDLAQKQDQEDMEMTHQEMKHLKSEIARLGQSALDKAGRDAEVQAAIKARDEAEAREEICRMKLEACQKDFEQQRRTFDKQIMALQTRLSTENSTGRTSGRHRSESQTQEAITASLAASRAKQSELQKQYAVLVRKYTALQSSMFDAPLPSPVQITPKNLAQPRVSYLEEGIEDATTPAGVGAAISGGHHYIGGDIPPPTTHLYHASSQARHHGSSPGPWPLHRVFSNPDLSDSASVSSRSPQLLHAHMHSHHASGSVGGYGYPLPSRHPGAGHRQFSADSSSFGGGGGGGSASASISGSIGGGGSGHTEVATPSSPLVQQRYHGRGGVQSKFRKEDKKKDEGSKKKSSGFRGIRGFV